MPNLAENLLAIEERVNGLNNEIIEATKNAVTVVAAELEEILIKNGGIKTHDGSIDLHSTVKLSFETIGNALATFPIEGEGKNFAMGLVGPMTIFPEAEDGGLVLSYGSVLTKKEKVKARIHLENKRYVPARDDTLHQRIELIMGGVDFPTVNAFFDLADTPGKSLHYFGQRHEMLEREFSELDHFDKVMFVAALVYAIGQAFPVNEAAPQQRAS